MSFLVLDHCSDPWGVISVLLSSHVSINHTSHIFPSVFASGVRASERLAEIDMPYLLRYQPVIRTVGRKYCMDPAVIAGVLSRESHGGNVMANVGNVDDGIGVVQVILCQLRYMAVVLHDMMVRGHLHIYCCGHLQCSSVEHRVKGAPWHCESHSSA